VRVEGGIVLIRDPNREWEKFGKSEPYFGVITHDKFRKSKLNEQSIFEFFKSGQEHIDYVLDTIRAVDSGFLPRRVLDFGCGVGRCTIPLARIRKAVVGIDVSASMLQEARNNCRRHSVSNVEFALSEDDNLSQVHGEFDLIHSVFVLQCIPRNNGMRLLRRMAELLSPDGVGAIQILYEREVSRVVKGVGFLRKSVPIVHYFANRVYGKPLTEPLVEKNVYDLNRILGELSRVGCGNVQLSLFNEGVHRYCMLFFRKRRDRVPHESLAAS
jgi:ubiquinone/menaquinone biosynthesis C-methylase UbiE